MDNRSAVEPSSVASTFLLPLLILMACDGGLFALSQAGKPGQPKPRARTARPNSAPVPVTALSGKIPAPTAEQDQAMREVQDRLKALAAGAGTSQDEIRELAGDLARLTDNPPDKALVQDFAEELSMALAGKVFRMPQMTHLTRDLYALMNSAGLSTREVKSVQADLGRVLESIGAAREGVRRVAQDAFEVYLAMRSK